MNPAQQAILSRLSPEDQIAFLQTIEHLREAAYRNSVPEGSIAALLNKQSPGVRHAIAAISNTLETPRIAPFQEKWDERRNATELGFDDPDAAVHIKSVIDGQEVTSRLIDRMGADQPSDEPLTTREQVEAAYDHHTGAEDGH